jgi:hypothetical protein
MPASTVSKTRNVDAHAKSEANRRQRRNAKVAAGIGIAGLVATLVSACPGTNNNKTLFQSNFNATATGQPPAQHQQVGTASSYGQAGGVVIVNAPPGSTDHWVSIGRSDNKQPVTGMICNLSQTAGPGKYNFTAAIYMPPAPSVENANVASISFVSQNDLQAPNAGGAYPGFMHLDLLANNTIRIGDTVNTSVSFSRNQPFDLTVNLDTTQASRATNPIASASITTLGNGTSGPHTTATYTIPIPPGQPSDPSQFAAVVLWMGYPWTGTFLASAPSVTNNT